MSQNEIIAITINGLTDEQAARVAYHGPETLAKVRKLATAKRAAFADALAPIPTEEPTPSQNEGLIGSLAEEPAPSMTYADLVGACLAAGYSLAQLAGLAPEDLAGAIGYDGEITDVPAIEVTIAPAPAAPAPLLDGRRRSHYEADMTGEARFRSAAARHGERVTYAPYAWGGEAHMTIAAVMWSLGKRPGDPVSHADMAHVPGRLASQARFGSEASRRTAIHRLANAGMLDRITATGGKRAEGYTVPGVTFSEAAEAAARLGLTDPIWLEIRACLAPAEIDG